MKIQQHIGLYCKNTKYSNYSTTAQNTIILYLLVDLVHIYLVFGCHSSLSIDFTALTCGHIVNYHNAPVRCTCIVTGNFFNVIMEITF